MFSYQENETIPRLGQRSQGCESIEEWCQFQAIRQTRVILVAIDFFHDVGQERTPVVYSGIVLAGDGKRVTRGRCCWTDYYDRPQWNPPPDC